MLKDLKEEIKKDLLFEKGLENDYEEKKQRFRRRKFKRVKK